jgi:hypothetical protein
MIHLLAAFLPTANSPFEWASQHLQIIGWPALVIFAWRVATYFERITSQASKTVGQIDMLATNHMPHMETSLISMEKSLTTIAENSHRRREDF